MLKKKVVWIGDTGFDKSGAATLGIKFHEILKIETLFRGNTEEVPGILLWETVSDLDSKLKELNPEVILLLPNFLNKVYDNKMKEFFEVVFNYQSDNCKIIFIDCSRNGVINKNKDNKETINQFKEIFPYKFDCMWSITNETKDNWKDFYKEHKLIDLNIYKTNKQIQIERERTIGYMSRLSGFKGSGRFFKAVENKERLKMSIVHFGSYHDPKRWKEQEVIAGNIIPINYFAKSLTDKRPKEIYSIKESIYDDVVCNKMNIYPRYSQNDVPYIISRIGIAICPTLARAKKDKDEKYIAKNKDRWKLALEYVNYELIDYGVPVMFSKDFCLSYDPTMIERFPELIYDNLEDCLEYVEENYDKLLQSAYKQKEWLEEKTIIIEQNIINELNNLFL